MEELKAGIRAELEFSVDGADTADRWGSGLVPVLSTPALVGRMEQAAVRALQERLPNGRTTVGGRIDVRHLAPTPVGMRVQVRAELVEVDGRRLVFQIEARDEAEVIGQAVHECFVIDEARFMERVRSKGQ